MEVSRNDYYTKVNLLDYLYQQKYCKLIADRKTIQQIAIAGQSKKSRQLNCYWWICICFNETRLKFP